MRYVWACAAVAGFLSVCLLVSRPAVVSAQDKQKARLVWEYKVLYGMQVQDYGGAKSEEEGLNKLGAEGWELVTVLPGIPHPGSVAQSEKDVKAGTGPTTLTLALQPYYYLKRPK
jgi:hypothetical protein